MNNTSFTKVSEYCLLYRKCWVLFVCKLLLLGLIKKATQNIRTLAVTQDTSLQAGNGFMTGTQLSCYLMQNNGDLDKNVPWGTEEDYWIMNLWLRKHSIASTKNKTKKETKRHGTSTKFIIESMQFSADWKKHSHHLESCHAAGVDRRIVLSRIFDGTHAWLVADAGTGTALGDSRQPWWSGMQTSSDRVLKSAPSKPPRRITITMGRRTLRKVGHQALPSAQLKLPLINIACKVGKAQLSMTELP